MKKLWFKNKSYGWGWTPASWEGWLVTAGFIAFVVAWPLILLLKVDETALENDPRIITLFYAVMTLAVMALLVVCWKTGEKPEWHWGGKPISKKDGTPNETK